MAGEEEETTDDDDDDVIVPRSGWKTAAVVDAGEEEMEDEEEENPPLVAIPLFMWLSPLNARAAIPSEDVTEQGELCPSPGRESSERPLGRLEKGEEEEDFRSIQDGQV